MNKTISVNLGGMLFHIDDEAYGILSAWLQEVERQFLHDPDREDIMQDIESRLGELFAQEINRSNQLILTGQVNRVIEIMGEPHNFSDDEAQEERHEEKKYYKKAKRMYRDPDSRMLGGVCGGLGAYFHTDPWVFRIVFIVFSVFFLAGFFVYLILWVAIPEAKNTAQKLEMRGEPVNIENITNAVKDEFSKVREKMRF
jgi:phage shock protein C